MGRIKYCMCLACQRTCIRVFRVSSGNSAMSTDAPARPR